jgi:hypothetical protein
MGKRTTIKITTESFFLLRSFSSGLISCPYCASEMVTLERACALSGQEPGSLEKWLEVASVHRLKVSDGSWLICLQSLGNRLQRNDTDDPCGS